MEVWECISIKGKGAPFPEPLPAAPSALIEALGRHGFEFEESDQWSIKQDNRYTPDRFGRIKQVVALEGWEVDVARQFWTVFTDADYEQAPLWNTYFPDLWIDEIDFSSTCDECGRKRIEVDTSVRVSKVKSKRPLHSVNGQFNIVAGEVKSAIVGSLTGACFHPFDEQGRYFCLGSECDLGSLVIKDDEVLDYAGECSLCRLPKFTTFFGPLRFTKSLWSSEDVVREGFHDGCLFTPKAFDLLRTFDRSLSRDGIALLG